MDIRPIRRVVTGHDAQGRAVVVMDGPATNVLHRPSRPGMALTDLWATDGTPTAQTGGDPVDRPVVLHPPRGGTVFRIIQFDPEDPSALAHADGATAFAAMGAAGTLPPRARPPHLPPPDPLDYAGGLQGPVPKRLHGADVGPSARQVRIPNWANHPL